MDDFTSDEKVIKWVKEMESTFGVESFDVTVKEVYEALKKNGFDHLRGTWFRYDDLGMFVVGGCVLGQAALNLGAYQPSQQEGYQDNSVLGQLNRFGFTPGKWDWEQNEDEVPKTLGTQIIHWNDEEAPDGGWELETYDEVAQMAFDCMKPYFNEVITLERHTWDIKQVS